MPQYKVDCIRVTHPCAGLAYLILLLNRLPLDLHVLGLPLAFILSQDQTLHCKKFNLLAFVLPFFLLHYFKELFCFRFSTLSSKRAANILGFSFSNQILLKLFFQPLLILAFLFDQRTLSFLKSGCKCTPIFFPCKCRSNIFSRLLLNVFFINVKKTHYFFIAFSKPPFHSKKLAEFHTLVILYPFGAVYLHPIQ